MEEELVDIVDRNNKVIGSAPRKGIHKTDLLHRSVHIFLIDLQEKIWLEKRAENTDTFPGYFNSSAAGHVSKGESYLEGAKREAEEELGNGDLGMRQVHMLNASDETSNEFVAFFVAKSDYVPRTHEATQSLTKYGINEIETMMANGEPFVPIFMKLFEWYKENRDKA